MADNSIKVTLSPKKREKFKAALVRKRITQQSAIEGLIDTMLEQTDAGQSLFLGQITDPGERREIAKMILRRWAEEDDQASRKSRGGGK